MTDVAGIARRRAGFSALNPLRGLSSQDAITKVAIVVITVLMLVYILLPVFWMVKSSFQSALDIRATPPIWFPSSLNLEAYEEVDLVIPVWRYLYNSVYVSLIATLFATAIATAAAYVLARFRFPYATLILTLILITQLIPPITRVFPIYTFIQNLGLLNTYAGIIIAYIGFSLPFAVLLLRGYFETSSPPELEEAAMVDGCTHFSAFWRIILPVSLPGIAAVAVFTFLNAWNDFLWASILLNQGDMKTIQVGIGDFASEGGGVQYVNLFMAACVVATIPALIMFLFVQRWLVGGLTAGSVK